MRVEGLYHIENNEVYEIFADESKRFYFDYLFDMEESMSNVPIVDFTELMLRNGISVFEEFSDEDMEAILKELK